MDWGCMGEDPQKNGESKRIQIAKIQSKNFVGGIWSHILEGKRVCTTCMLPWKARGEDSGKLDLPPAARASLEKDQGGLKTWRLEAEEPRGWDRKGTYPGDEMSLRDSLWRRSSSSRVILRLWKMKRMKLKTKKWDWLHFCDSHDVFPKDALRSSYWAWIAMSNLLEFSCS